MIVKYNLFDYIYKFTIINQNKSSRANDLVS